MITPSGVVELGTWTASTRIRKGLTVTRGC